MLHKGEYRHYLGIPEVFSSQLQYAALQRLAMTRVRQGDVVDGMQIAVFESMSDRLYRIIDLAVEKKGRIVKTVTSVGNIHTGLSISGIQLTAGNEPVYELCLPLLPRIKIARHPTAADLAALGTVPTPLDNTMLQALIIDLTYARKITLTFYEERRILFPQMPKKDKSEFQ